MRYICVMFSPFFVWKRVENIECYIFSHILKVCVLEMPLLDPGDLNKQKVVQIIFVFCVILSYP